MANAEVHSERCEIHFININAPLNKGISMQNFLSHKKEHFKEAPNAIYIKITARYLLERSPTILQNVVNIRKMGNGRRVKVLSKEIRNSIQYLEG